MLDNVSIIIPLAPNEAAHNSLLESLKHTNAEVILSQKNGRATSLNAGAKQATREWLWFLHGDSIVSDKALTALDEAIHNHPDDLLYYDLKFAEGGLAKVNAVGANIRSRILNLPYGDQGLCLSKDQFNRIGGYDKPHRMAKIFCLSVKLNKRALQLLPCPAH